MIRQSDWLETASLPSASTPFATREGTPFTPTNRAVESCLPPPGRRSASIVQYSTGLKSLISCSRSTISRSATVCTGPALSPRRTLSQRSGDHLTNPPAGPALAGSAARPRRFSSPHRALREGGSHRLLSDLVKGDPPKPLLVLDYRQQLHRKMRRNRLAFHDRGQVPDRPYRPSPPASSGGRRPSPSQERQSASARRCVSSTPTPISFSADP